MVRAEYTTRFAGGNAGFVYIVRGDNGLAKIGRTRQLRGRIQMIRSSSAVAIDVIRVYDAENYRALEPALHQFAEGRLERGEWFRLSDDDLARVDAFVFSAPTQEDCGRVNRLVPRTGRILRSWRSVKADDEPVALAGQALVEPDLDRPRMTGRDLDAMIASWFGWMERTREETQPDAPGVPEPAAVPRQRTLFGDTAA